MNLHKSVKTMLFLSKTMLQKLSIICLKRPILVVSAEGDFLKKSFLTSTSGIRANL